MLDDLPCFIQNNAYAPCIGRCLVICSPKGHGQYPLAISEQWVIESVFHSKGFVFLGAVEAYANNLDVVGGVD